MTREALRAELAKGQSLAQIAKAKGKSVDGLEAAMLAPAKAALAKAVGNGRLTQQRADEILGRLADRIEKLVQRVPQKKALARGREERANAVPPAPAPGCSVGALA